MELTETKLGKQLIAGVVATVIMGSCVWAQETSEEEAPISPEVFAAGLERQELKVKRMSGKEMEELLKDRGAGDSPAALGSEEMRDLRAAPEARDLRAARAARDAGVNEETGKSQGLQLYEAVELAIETHPLILADKEAYKASSEESRVVRSGLGNSLSFDFSGGHETSYNEVTRARVRSGEYAEEQHDLWRNSASLSFKRLLFDRRGTRNRFEAAKAYERASSFKLFDSCEEIAVHAAEAFLDVLRYRINNDLSQENIRAHEETYENTRRRAQSGAGTVADVEQAKARLARAKASSFETRGALKDAEAFYIETFGVKPDALERPQRPVSYIPASLEEAIEVAKKSHHGIKKLKEELKGRQAELRAAKSAFAPRFDLELSASRTENVNGLEENAWDHQALIVGSFDFSTGGRRGAKLKKARHEKMETEHRLQALERRVEKQVREAWTALETTERRLSELERNVRHNEAVLDAYHGQFKMGKRSLLDLLDAQTEIFQSKVSLNDGRIIHLFAHFRLLYSMNKVLTSLELENALEM